jgi:hypothetical protein
MRAKYCFVVMCIAASLSINAHEFGVKGGYGWSSTPQTMTGAYPFGANYTALDGTFFSTDAFYRTSFSSGDGINIGVIGQLGYTRYDVDDLVVGDKLPSLDSGGNVVWTTFSTGLLCVVEAMDVAVGASFTLGGFTLDVGAASLVPVNVEGTETFYADGLAIFDPYIFPYANGIVAILLGD